MQRARRRACAGTRSAASAASARRPAGSAARRDRQAAARRRTCSGAVADRDAPSPRRLDRAAATAAGGVDGGPVQPAAVAVRRPSRPRGAGRRWRPARGPAGGAAEGVERAHAVRRDAQRLAHAAAVTRPTRRPVNGPGPEPGHDRAEVARAGAGLGEDRVDLRREQLAVRAGVDRAALGEPAGPLRGDLGDRRRHRGRRGVQSQDEQLRHATSPGSWRRRAIAGRPGHRIPRTTMSSTLAPGSQSIGWPAGVGERLVGRAERAAAAEALAG